MNEALFRKLQKIRVMIERAGTTHEQALARKVFDELVEKYDVDESKIEGEREQRVLKHAYGMRRYVAQVCESLGFTCYRYVHKRKPPLLVDCTVTEFNLLNDLVRQLTILYDARLKAARIAVDSYMHGFVTAVYPVSDAPPACPRCGKPLVYCEYRRRYECGACGYTGKRLKIRHLDEASFLHGQSESGRLLQYRAVA